MNLVEERARNQAAYRRLKESLDQKYPPGRFLALVGGRVIADADSFEELRSRLTAGGHDPAQALIVQAGVEYPEDVVIFI
jgi:hypothetical protein